MSALADPTTTSGGSMSFASGDGVLEEFIQKEGNGRCLVVDWLLLKLQ